MPEIKREIITGLKLLKSFEIVSILGEPIFWESYNFWSIHLKIKLLKNNLFINTETFWYLVVHNDYPYKEVNLFPAKENGISVTYPHQSYNDLDANSEFPWRKGKLCLDSPVKKIGIFFTNSDPIGITEERIAWYMHRAIKWLEAAIDNKLLKEGEPFETPHYPFRYNKSLKIIHDENIKSFRIWENIKQKFGFVNLSSVSFNNNYLAIKDFQTVNSELIFKTSFNARIFTDDYQFKGLFWIWPGYIIKKPWEIPTTWNDIRILGNELGINVNSELKRITSFARGKEICFLLFGYPIPKIVGGNPCEMYWQSIKFPLLSNKGKPQKGFRANEEGFWQRDLREHFYQNKELEYYITENWHSNRLLARGKLNLNLLKKKIAIIGIGAIGALIAELLIRQGVKNLLLIDNDFIEPGNVVRYNATFDDIYKSKPKSIKTYLDKISVTAQIDALELNFVDNYSTIKKIIKDKEIIIECTGSDEVIERLGCDWWSIPKYFFSISIGYKARQLYFYQEFANQFSSDSFKTKISDILKVNGNNWQFSGELIEGVGCWSPLFPARYDDIMLAASTSIKLIENRINDYSFSNSLLVFEKQEDNQNFIGFNKIDEL